MHQAITPTAIVSMAGVFLAAGIPGFAVATANDLTYAAMYPSLSAGLPQVAL
jgi:hypothetical protein